MPLVKRSSRAAARHPDRSAVVSLNGRFRRALDTGKAAAGELDFVSLLDTVELRVKEYEAQAMRRFLLGAAAIVALTLPALSFAGTASVVFDEVVFYVAAAGEANRVIATSGPPGVRIQDLGAPVVAGAGCTAVSANEVLCTSAALPPPLAVRVGDRNDSVRARGAFSFVTQQAGPGNDVLNGGTRNDSLLIGGKGNDTLKAPGLFSSLFGRAGNDTLRGGPHTDRLNGGDGNDLLRGRGGRDSLSGGPGSDFLNGQRGSDWAVQGDRGADTVRGGAGRDQVSGGPGRDRIGGGDGADTLFARDRRRDRVWGGPGADRARVDRRLDVLLTVESLF